MKPMTDMNKITILMIPKMINKPIEFGPDVAPIEFNGIQ